MSHTLFVDAVGTTIRVDLAGLDEQSRSAVRRVWRDAAAARPAHARAAATVVATASVSREVVLADLSQRVTLAALEAARGTAWMLHAAGVATHDGRVAVLVGPSGRGKTTAALNLGRALGYVSDEAVAIGADGGVRPYRKPLSIIDRIDAPKTQTAPSDLGLRALPQAPLSLGAIVLLDRRDDAPEEPLVEIVDLGDALPELIAQTSHLADLPAPLQTVAAHVASVGGVRRVRYRDAADLAGVVEALLGSARVQNIPAVSRSAPPGTALPAEDAPHDEERWFRAPAIDVLALEDPERLAVLRGAAGSRHEGGATVHLLAGIAPALWRAAADGVSADGLVAAAVAAYGDPGMGAEATGLVEAAVEELAAAGLLVRRARRWRIRGDVAWTGGRDRVAVLTLGVADESPLALEGSAALIWLALAERPVDMRTLVERVARSAGAEPDVVRADVTAFVAELLHGGLVAPG